VCRALRQAGFVAELAEPVFETGGRLAFPEETSRGTGIDVLGGNQSDQVCIPRIPRGRLIAARRAPWRSAQPANVRRIVLSTAGAMSASEGGPAPLSFTTPENIHVPQVRTHGSARARHADLGLSRLHPCRGDREGGRGGDRRAGAAGLGRFKAHGPAFTVPAQPEAALRLPYPGPTRSRRPLLPLGLPATRSPSPGASG
jgi:hypothetical protein